MWFNLDDFNVIGQYFCLQACRVMKEGRFIASLRAENLEKRSETR